ncbi:hypothetical protein Tco_1473990 [Tanacetum coccineum]
MLDYGFNFMNIRIYIDNVSTICIVKNPVFHSKTKHIEIRHHFIRDAYEKKLIQVLKIHADDNVADLLTKAFDVSRFFILPVLLGLGKKMQFRLVLRVKNGSRQNIGAARQNWCCQAKLVLPGKISVARQNWCCQAKLSLIFSKSTISHTLFILFNASMDNLDFVEQHNMVAYLEKTEGNKDFHEIVDFLSFSTIHHALTTVNNEKQIATVDSKAVVVTEASIRSSLLFNDADDDHTSSRAEGSMNLDELIVLCTNLLNRVLALESIKDAQAVAILQLKSKIKKLEKKYKPIISHHRAWLKSVHKLSLKKRLGKKEFVSKQGRKTTKPGPTLDDSTFDDLDVDHGMNYMDIKEPVNEGRQSRETEEVKLTTDTEEIAKDKGSGEKGRSTEELVSTAEPEIVSTARPEVSTIGIVEPEVDAARQEDSDVEPRTPPTTTSIFDDEDITMAQTLIKIKEEKAKEKGVTIKEVEDSDRPARSILTLKPLPIIDPKDKGKGVLKELPVKKFKRSDLDAAQIAKDAEVARLVYEEELAKLEREKEERKRQKEASKVAIAKMYDEVQAGIDADALFAAKLQQEEREEYTIEERAKFLAETIAAQRKFRAAQRSVEIRSRPPTKSQLRNLMMTYLKNMGGYKHSQLKTKTFKEIQGMYERQKKIVDDFKHIDSDDAVKDSEKAADDDTSKKEEVLEEPDSTKVEVKKEEHEENIKKRPGRRLKMKATKKSKRQKTDANLKEEEQLRAFLQIVPNEEEHGAECIYYRIFRSDGSSRWIKTFSEMVTRFDRMDLEELYNLVMQRFETTTPEGVDLVLWGDLRIMFEEHADDDLWKNQEKWMLKSWSFYANCRVHVLMLEDDSFKSKLMNLEAMMEVRRIFKCWFYNHTTNGHQFTMSNRHQELTSPEVNDLCKELASLKQTTLGKDISNPLIVDSLLKTIWLSMHHVMAMEHWLFQSKRLLEAKDYKVIKEFKFIKEKIKKLQYIWIHPPVLPESNLMLPVDIFNAALMGSYYCPYVFNAAHLYLILLHDIHIMLIGRGFVISWAAYYDNWTGGITTAGKLNAAANSISTARCNRRYYCVLVVNTASMLDLVSTVRWFLVLPEDEDFVKRRDIGLFILGQYSNHYLEPTEFKIQEMVNILVSGEAYCLNV